MHLGLSLVDRIAFWKKHVLAGISTSTLTKTDQVPHAKLGNNKLDSSDPALSLSKSQEVHSPPTSSKEDLSKEEKKHKKGFFGTLKTFVSKSTDHSDSDSERSPKKEPKKKKKKKEKIPPQELPPVRPPRKPKLPTPREERKEYTDIPFVESDSTTPTEPVTDLDVDVPVIKAKENETTVTFDSDSKSAPQIPSKTRTITVIEKVEKTFQPFSIEAEEFSLTIDPTKKEVKGKAKETFTIKIDESVTQIEKKPPILPEEHIIKPQVDLEAPLRPPRQKGHVYEDIAEPVDVRKATTDFINSEMQFAAWADDKHNVKKSPDKVLSKSTEKIPHKRKEKKLFGFLSKRHSKDTDESEEESSKQEIIEKHDRELSKERKEEVKKQKKSKKPKDEKEKIPELSEEVLKHMEDSRVFLTEEINRYVSFPPEKTSSTILDEQPKPQLEVLPEQEQKKSGLLGLFSKKPRKDEIKLEEEIKVRDSQPITEEVQKSITDCKAFLETEVDKHEDSKVISAPKQDVVKVEQKVRLEEALPLKIELSEETIQKMNDSRDFLNTEVETYFSFKPEVEKVIEVVEKTEEKADRKKSGFLGIFGKKQKSKEIQEPLLPVQLSEKVIQQMKDSESFLKTEVDKFEDVRHESIAQNDVIEKVEEIESKKSPILSLFGKKTKKESTPPPAEAKITEDTLKNMKDSQAFLQGEVGKYFSYKPEVRITEPEIKEARIEIVDVPKAETDDIVKNEPIVLSEETLRNMKDTDSFLQEEVNRYISFKPEVKPIVPERKEKSPAKSKKVEKSEHKKGFLGLFSKKQKSEEAIPVAFSEEVKRDMENTTAFLQTEVAKHEDVKYVPKRPVSEEIVKTIEEVESKKSPILSLFSKKPKKEPTPPPEKVKISDETMKHMKDSNAFLSEEVDRYFSHRPEVRTVEPETEKTSIEIVDVCNTMPDEIAPKESIILSEETLRNMSDTNNFLQEEVNRYISFRPEVTPMLHEKKDKSLAKSKKEEKAEHRKGFLGLFSKKQKSEDATPVAFSEEVIRDMENTTAFLQTEVAKHEDVRYRPKQPISDEVIKEIEEVETKKSPIISLFGKKQKKELTPPPQEVRVSEETLKNMKESHAFLHDEVSKYFSYKPEVEAKELETKKTNIEVVDAEQTKAPNETIVLSEEVTKNMNDTNNFLQEEVSRYISFKPDLKPTVSETKEKSPVKAKKEEKAEHKKGFLGLFSKKHKSEETIPVAFSEEVKRDMENTNAFLQTELVNYEDVRYVPTQPISKKVLEEIDEVESKKSPLLSLFSRKPKKEATPPPKEAVSEETAKNLKDCELFLKQEVDKYISFRPDPAKQAAAETAIKESSLSGLFSARETTPPPKEAVAQLSEEAIQNMKDTESFLEEEVERYISFRPEPKAVVEETVEESGFCGLFASKKSENILEDDLEELQQQRENAGAFLTNEIEKYEDVKFLPKSDEVKSVEEEHEKTGFFGLFAKKTKEEDTVEDKIVEVKISEEVRKHMDDTCQFLSTEVKNYNDGKYESPLAKDEHLQKQHTERLTGQKTDSEDEEERGGFFGLFGKKSKKPPEEKSQAPSDEILKSIDETQNFLIEEVTKFHDVKPIIKPIEKPAAIETERQKSEEREEEKKTFFGLFSKKPKKHSSKSDESDVDEEDVQARKQRILKEMYDTSKFLDEEVSRYNDVKPQITAFSQDLEASLKVKDVLTEIQKPDGAQPIQKEQAKLDVRSEKLAAKRERKKSGSPFRLFSRKSKSEEREVEPPKAIVLSEETLRNMDDSRSFLTTEVNNYNDCKPKIQPVTDKETEESIEFESKSTGLFSIFSKKDVRGSPGTTRKKPKKPKKSRSQERTKSPEKKILSDTEDSADDSKKKGFFSKIGEKFAGKVDDLVESGKEELQCTADETVRVQNEIIDTAKTKETELLRAEEQGIEIVAATKTEGERKASEEFITSQAKVSQEAAEINKTVDEEFQRADEQVEAAKGEIVAVSGTMKETKEKISKEAHHLAQTSPEEAEKLVKKSGGFFSKFGKKITGKLDDSKKKLKEEEGKVAATAEDIQQTVIETTEDGEKYLEDVSKSAEDLVDENLRIAVEAAESLISKTEESAKGAKEDTKEKLVETLDYAAQDIREGESLIDKSKKEVDNATKSAGGFFNKLGKKISGKVDNAKGAVKDAEKKAASASEDTKEALVEGYQALTTELQDGTQHAARKLEASGEIIKEGLDDGKEDIERIGEGIAKTVQATSETVQEKYGATAVSVHESLKDPQKKVEDSVVDGVEKISDVIKEEEEKAAKRSSGFFSKIGKKLSGKVEGTKEAVKQESLEIENKWGKTEEDGKQLIEIGKESMAQTAQSATEAFIDAERKTKDSVGVAGKLIDDKTHEAQTYIEKSEEGLKDLSESVRADALEIKTTAKTKIQEEGDKLKDTVETITDEAEKSAKRSGGFLIKIGKKLSGKTEETVKDKEKKAATVFYDTEESLIDGAKNIEQKLVESQKAISAAAKSVIDETKPTIDDTKSTIEAGGDSVKDKTENLLEQLKTETQDAKSKIKKGAVDAAEKTKEAIYVSKDEADKAAKRSSGFLGKIGKKITGKVESATKEAQEKGAAVFYDAEEITSEELKNAAAVAQETRDNVELTEKDTKAKAEQLTTELKPDVDYAVQQIADGTKTSIEECGEKLQNVERSTKHDVNALIEGVREPVQETKETVLHAVDVTKDAADQVAEQSGGFFSKIGKILSHEADDATDSAQKAEDNVYSVFYDTKETLAGSAQKVSDSKEAVTSDAKDVAEGLKAETEKLATIVSDKETEVTSKVEAALEDFTDTAKHSTTQLIKGTKAATDNIQEKTEEIITTSKDAKAEAEKQAGGFFSKIGKKISGKGESIKESSKETQEKLGSETTGFTISTAESTIEPVAKLQDATDVTDAATKRSVAKAAVAAEKAKDKVEAEAKKINHEAEKAAKRSGGFLSKIGKKISGKVEDAKESTKDAGKAVVEGIEETRQATEVAVHEIKDKYADVAEKAKKTGEDINESLETVAEQTGEKTKQATEGVKASLKEAEHVFEKSIEKGIEDTKDLAGTAKVESEKTAKRTGGFFSKIGKKISGKADDAEETAKDVQEKLATAVVDTKEATSSSIDKTKEFLQDAKETASTESGKLKDEIEQGKEIVVDTVGLVSESVASHLHGVVCATNKTEDMAKDAALAVKHKAEDTTENLIDKTGEAVEASLTSAKESVDKEVNKIGSELKHVEETVASSLESATFTIKEVDDIAKESFDIKTEQACKTLNEEMDEFIASTKKVATSTTESLKDAGEEGKRQIAGAKDAIKEEGGKLKEDAEKAAKRSSGFFGKIGKKLTGKAEDTKKAVKEVEKKVEGELAEVKSKSEKLEQDINVQGQELSDKGQQVVTNVSLPATETVDATKQFLEEAQYKIESDLSKIPSLLEGAEKNIEEKTQIGEEIAEDVKTRTATALTDIKKESKITSQHLLEDSHEAALVVQQKSAETLVQTAELTKEELAHAEKKLKEKKEKSEGFLKKIGKKLSGKAEDAKESAEKLVKDLRDDPHQKIEADKEPLSEIEKEMAEAVKDASARIQDTSAEVGESIRKGVAGLAKQSSEELQEKLREKEQEILDGLEKLDEQIKTAKDTAKMEGEIFVSDVTTVEEAVDQDNSYERRKIQQDIAEKEHELFNAGAQVYDKTKTEVKNFDDVTEDFLTQLRDDVNAAKINVESSSEKSSSKAEEFVQDIDDKFKGALEETEKSAKKSSSFLTKIGKKIMGKSDEVKKTGKEEISNVETTVEDDVKQKGVTFAESVKTEADVNVYGLQSKIANIAADFRQGSEDLSVKFDQCKGTASNAFADLPKLPEDAVKATADFMFQEMKHSDEQFSTDDILTGGLTTKPEVKMTRAVSDYSGRATLQEQAGERKISEANIDLSSFLLSDDGKPYVTSPTAKRRVQSQRFPRGERPELIEVTHAVLDTSSDDDDYVVTEPLDENQQKRKPLFHIASEDDDTVQVEERRRGSSKSNVLESLSEQDVETLLSGLDKPVEHITITRTTVVTHVGGDSKIDVEEIEQKLCDLDKALGSLESAAVPDDEKLERKLRRVERKFERMASEAMDKEKQPKLTTPEFEERQESEFRKVVSQLSTEEVSDFQKEYSTLWDDQTFSPTDDLVSKTPDSQADVQELPKGRC